MPATYAAVRAALAEAAAAVPDFAPQTLLDVGAGPGTAAWAALDAWPSLRRAVLVDDNPHLLALAEEFRGSPAAPDVRLSATHGKLAAALAATEPADVVMASYILTELGDGASLSALEALWSKTARLLVVVEPGTPDGFRRILACRTRLLARRAVAIAPCAHEGHCPLASPERWCHFSARLPRSRAHRATKDANVPFEDEKFSYLIAGKDFGDPPRGRRVLATPKVDKSAVTLTLCAPDAPEKRRIARSDKAAWRAAKRLAWGDALFD
jgi:ribosomal protein RSM22 (predicted rRNA methylase)